MGLCESCELHKECLPEAAELPEARGTWGGSHAKQRTWNDGPGSSCLAGTFPWGLGVTPAWRFSGVAEARAALDRDGAAFGPFGSDRLLDPGVQPE